MGATSHAAVSSQLRIPSLSPSQISFKNKNLHSISVRLESLPFGTHRAVNPELTYETQSDPLL